MIYVLLRFLKYLCTTIFFDLVCFLSPNNCIKLCLATLHIILATKIVQSDADNCLGACQDPEPRNCIQFLDVASLGL